MRGRNPASSNLFYGIGEINIAVAPAVGAYDTAVCPHGFMSDTFSDFSGGFYGNGDNIHNGMNGNMSLLR